MDSVSLPIFQILIQFLNLAIMLGIIVIIILVIILLIKLIKKH